MVVKAENHVQPIQVPRDERLCSFCKTQTNSVKEDEKHNLLHCPRYESLGKDLYNSINEPCPNFKKLRDDDEFYSLLNSDGSFVKWLLDSFILHL